MRQIKWWQFLRSFGLEFWLPLPLLGVAFWLASGLLTEHSLNQKGSSVEPFKITPEETEPAAKILFIKVTVDSDRNVSQVKVKQATQVYQKEEFELATTDSKQLPIAIAKKLGLTPAQVSQLLRYQVK
ncbi:MAG: hypothetical protein AAGF83_27925 [Cyanobacteria bacterium P01_G01_bin.67]